VQPEGLCQSSSVHNAKYLRSTFSQSQTVPAFTNRNIYTLTRVFLVKNKTQQVGVFHQWSDNTIILQDMYNVSDGFLKHNNEKRGKNCIQSLPKKLHY